MNKNLLVGGGVLATIAVAVLFYFSLDQGEIEKLTASETAPVTEAPVIDVEVEGVMIIKDGKERNAIDGESVTPPYELRSDASGKATIRFSEGSELRLDKNSQIRIESAAYAPESKNLLMHVKLTVGRVWSDIVSLATPESSWEVETSNVVATVRGTSFGVIAELNGTTTVLGSEHTIELTIIDPETGERKESRKTKLSEDEFAVITDEEAQDDAGTEPKTNKKTDKEENDPWFRLNEEIDADLLNANTEEPSDDTETGTETETLIDTRTTTPPEPIRQESPAPATQPAPAQTSSNAPAKKASSLTVTSATTLNGIVEGTPARLTATLAYTDGSKKDVTGEVTWKVVGSIGSVSGSVFTPLLDASVAEYGRAPGSITATWADAATGESLLGTTPIFEVKAKVGVINENG